MSSHKTKVIKHVTKTRVEHKDPKKSYTTYDITTFNITGPFSDPTCTSPAAAEPPRSGRGAVWHSEVDENTLPFAVPKTEKDHEKINALLKFCKEQQKEFDISNRPGFVEVILLRCLQALGIKTSMIYGYRDICGPTSQVHVWLQVNEHHIDNTYWGCKSSFHYLIQNYPHCYLPCDSFETTKPPNPRGNECEYARKKRIEFFSAFPDYGLALCLNREQSYNFYFTMIRYMFDEHKVSVLGIAPEVRYQCWHCFKFPKAGLAYLSNIIDDDLEKEDIIDDLTPAPGSPSWKFLQCPQCLVASYCSRKCQQEDWAGVHSINCQPKDIPFLPDNFS